MRFATDTGGTFTDLVVDDGQGNWSMYKAATTPDDPVMGVIDALQKAADDMDCSLSDMLAKGEMFIHGTTHAINAIVTGNTAKTAFLTTEGHPDILRLREGGRSQPFNHTVRYPDSYVPRRLTFEVPERIDFAGNVVTTLDEQAVMEILDQLKAEQVEAVAVCLLWSISNSAHEVRLGEMISEYLPGIPYTLSHKLNPALREYRRASSACMDASLKPLMGEYLGSLTSRLSTAGFDGRVYVVSSQGGMMEAAHLAQAPIHAINSGPSMAPVSGRYYAGIEGDAGAVIVADTGGTTYDVSLVCDQRIPMTREMWIGDEYRGHMTGFPSVDVKSIGAGGGSIAWVDNGGILHVGPQSAGSVPGPACYNQGGQQATLTDACVVLGYLDPEYFLGGTMDIVADKARSAIQKNVADPLNITLREAAWSIVDLATENMTQAIVDISVNQGIDPAEGVLIGGGGAAGLNSTFIAERLGCKRLIIPEVGAALSAAGALMSELSTEYRKTAFLSTENFDFEVANTIIGDLSQQCHDFIDASGDQVITSQIEFTVEARYPNQVWEIEMPLPLSTFSGADDLVTITEAFHQAHERIFAIRDANSQVEIVTWTATVRCRVVAEDSAGRLGEGVKAENTPVRSRQCGFYQGKELTTEIINFDGLESDQAKVGPAIVESPFTTVVIDPGSTYWKSSNGSLIIEREGA